MKITKKIKNIFFDLDGTLLPMDTQIFVNIYYSSVSEHFNELPRKFIYQVLTAGIEAMYKNNGSKTNKEAFIEAFDNFGLGFENYEKRFEDFYNTEFNNCIKACKITNISKRIIDTLKNKGYTICIATNPIFPKVATYKRLEWLGIDPESVSIVTTYENSTFTKPNPNYYLEIINKLNLNIDETLMIGNDVLEDGASRKIGIDTILIDTCLINSHNLPINDFQKGSLEDLLNLCLELEEVN